MFRFDFKVENSNKHCFKKDNHIETETLQTKNTNVLCYDAEEIKITKHHFDNIELYQLNCIKLAEDLPNIFHIQTEGFLETFCSTDMETDIKKADETHSDLIPGVYEGGAKVWECTEDLIRFLLRTYKTEIYKNKVVLDLGCGSGLLGIYALQSDATVHFQDYNSDVIKNVTIPTVVLNLNSTESKDFQKVKFYSGDWQKYAEFITNDVKFDYIFTSETIYNPLNYTKLLNTLKKLLKIDGVVFLAAKTYYFGVGGGTRQFEELLIKHDYFKFKTVWSSTEDGVSREILKIKVK